MKDKVLLAVDFLEIRIVSEVFNYIDALIDNSVPYNKKYILDFVENVLINELKRFISQKIKTLETKYQINNFFSQSMNQFDSYIPELRFDKFYKRFMNKLCKYGCRTDNTEYVRCFNDTSKAFKKNIEKYQKLIEEEMDRYKEREERYKINGQNIIPVKKLKYDLTNPQLAYGIKIAKEINLIINECDNKELSNIISNCFETKRSKNPSEDDIYNNLFENNRELNEFWIKKLKDIIDFLKKKDI